MQNLSNMIRYSILNNFINQIKENKMKGYSRSDPELGVSDMLFNVYEQGAEFQHQGTDNASFARTMLLMGSSVI